MLGAAGMAPPAAAQVDFKFAMSAATPKVAWDGNLAVSANTSGEAGEPVCGKTPLDYCDHALFEVKEPGKLDLAATVADAYTDIDIYLHRSDASGTKGKLVKESSGFIGVHEKVSVTVEEPGFYLLVLSFYLSHGPSYKGEGTFTAGVEDLAASALPKSTIGRLPKSVKRRSLKGFSGTASDDGSVSKVEIALVRQQGRRCSAMTASGSFRASACTPTSFVAAKGTTSWSYKLRKKLAKGKYVLYSRATDDSGQVESTLTSANRKKFSVK